jgi:hypothetical protein
MILDLPVVLDYGPAYEDYNKRIIKTLQQMAADGRKRSTIKSAIWTLRSLNREADLMNPEAVKLHIANMKDKHGEPASGKKHLDPLMKRGFPDRMVNAGVSDMMGKKTVKKGSKGRWYIIENYFASKFGWGRRKIIRTMELPKAHPRRRKRKRII